MAKKESHTYRHVEHKRLMAAVYILLRLSVIAVMIAQFFNGNYENVFLCVLTLVLFMLPSMIERRFDIDLPDTLEIIILLFAYSAEILGEIQAYYIEFPVLGHHASYHERLFVRRHRLLPGGSAEPPGACLPEALSLLYGGGGFLLLHDCGRPLGIF